jgi:hypothetical protein
MNGSLKQLLAIMERYKSTQFKRAPWVVQDVDHGSEMVFFTDQNNKTKTATFKTIQKYSAKSIRKTKSRH